MKILLITDNHSPTGGAEKYFFELKERLKITPGIEVHSLGFGPEESLRGDVTILKGACSNITKLLWRILPHPLMYRKLRQKLAEIRPDVIHLHNIKQYTVALLQAIKPYPVVQTIHDHGMICPTAQNIHRDQTPCPTGLRLSCFWQHQVKHSKLVYVLLACAFFRIRQQLRQTVRLFLTPSPLLADYLIANNFQAAQYIPPFRKDKQALPFAQAHPQHFLFAGNLGSHKGVSILIEEFALACAQHPHLVLNIAGTGPKEQAMKTRVQALGITKNVNFLGWQQNMEPLYAANIALIFPSIGLEGFPLVMIDAMSYGRPIIGVNRGTTAWLLDDKQTGLLFDPLQKGDLANKILQLAGDSNLAKQLGQQSIAKIKTVIDNEAALAKIITAYKSIC